MAGSNPQSIRKVVDFPAPLAPSKPKTSPRPTSKGHPFNGVEVAEAPFHAPDFNDRTLAVAARVAVFGPAGWARGGGRRRCSACLPF